jgi:uncharacterized membrane protein YedE/YeeE
MEEINLNHIQNTVLWATFSLGVAFGAISHRTHFCTMGAVADVFNFGNWGRMKMWLVAIGISSLGLQLMHLNGSANLQDTLFLNKNWSWLSSISGGFLFGMGMVLASGCGSKTLIRLGTGNIKALVVFMVMGISAFMTLKGLFGVFRASYLDPIQIHFQSSPYLPDLLASFVNEKNFNLSPILSMTIPIVILSAALASKSAWNKEVILGGVGIGLTVLGVWWVIFQVAYLPEHPDTLEAAYLGSYANRAEGLSFVAPFAYTLEWLMFFSDANRVITIGVTASLGVVLGAYISALSQQSFRWESFQSVEDTANHLLGAVFMGIGGVLALGCTVGQGLSGISTLSLTSLITLGSILAGALLALKYQMWRVKCMV